MSIRFTPEAELDLIEIEEHYLKIASHLPEQFVEELIDHLDFLLNNPNAGIKIRKGYRCTHLSRFPYFVIYEIETVEFVVVQIVHDKRHPKMKFKRIK